MHPLLETGNFPNSMVEWSQNSDNALPVVVRQSFHPLYRVATPIMHLGWDDLDLDISPRLVGRYCSYFRLSRIVEHPKHKLLNQGAQTE